MDSRKPRGSGRTPAAGRRGGPFAERDFQRNLGPRRRPRRERDEPAFDDAAVDSGPRGRRGRGAGAAPPPATRPRPVSYKHKRAHETPDKISYAGVCL